MISEKNRLKHWIIESINRIQTWRRRAQGENSTITLTPLYPAPFSPLGIEDSPTYYTHLMNFRFFPLEWEKHHPRSVFWSCWDENASSSMILSYLNYHRGHMPSPPEIPFTGHTQLSRIRQCTTSQDALGAVSWPKAGQGDSHLHWNLELWHVDVLSSDTKNVTRGP